MARHSARIDAMQAGYALLAQEICQRSFRLPVAANITKLRYNETVDKGFARFHEAFRHAIIADQRIRQGHDLAAIRGVGQNLLIARHARIEYDFAECFRFIQQFTGKGAAVL